MTTVLFLDIDGVVYAPGNGNDDDDRFLPGALERLLELQAKGVMLVAFTARPVGKWIKNLDTAGVKLAGYCHKPLADHYAFIDDKLDLSLCGTHL